jgi:FMN phosphatase YigB (HAD superfamily)
MLWTCAWAASTLGMRTIWLLRGEAPSSPTLEQLNQSDAVVTNLASVPATVAGMSTGPTDKATPAELTS